MSFLGIGRQQPTSEQKIAAVEGEMRMMADTYNRWVFFFFFNILGLWWDGGIASRMSERRKEERTERTNEKERERENEVKNERMKERE